MNITAEMLEKRKAEAVAARDQHAAHANASSGVIQDCDHWLEVLRQAEAESPADEPSPE